MIKLRLKVALVLATLLVAANASSQIVLNMNTLFHSGDAQAMERIVEKFNEEHTDVQIELTQGQWADYYAQLYNAVVANDAPQIGIVHTTNLPQMAVALTPLEDSPAGNLLEIAGITPDKYISALWEAGDYDGHRYLVPLDTHMFGLWYNRDIFEEAGLDPDDPPTNREEFEAAANAIRDNTDAYAVHLAEDGLARKLARAWYYLYWGQGEELFNEDITQATFNNEAGLAACDYLTSVVDNGWNIAAGDGFRQFTAGDLGMLVAGNWFYWTATEAGINFGFAKMPVFFDTAKTWGNSHNLVIPKQPEGTPDEVYVAAANAIRWINENSDIWGIYGGHIPAYNEARESEALLESDTWQASLSTFAEMAEEGMLHYPITHESAAELEGVFNVYIEQAYNGTLSCEDALARAESEINSILGR